MIVELLPLILFACVFLVLLSGYPVALTLSGVALLFAAGGIATGTFDAGDLGFMPNRLFGIISNQTLIAVPLFVFMGVMLEKTEIARALLANLSALLRTVRGGLGLTVILVGMLLAASTGIVGATVVTMGLMSLPSMLEDDYDPALATGTISATGTLGQIIPPSIALVLLGDVLSNAYQQAQLNQGVFAPKTVSVGDLFAGAIVPGLVLVGLYIAYVMGVALLQPERVGGKRPRARSTVQMFELFTTLLAPLALIVAVLGSILGGLATPTEAAGVGAMGAVVLAILSGRFNISVLRDTAQATVRTTAMVFFILIGASIFSLVFRGFGGEELIHELFAGLPGGMWGALAIVMLIIFLLGFVLDFIEITFVVIPIVGPVLLALGADPVWLGVLIAVNLQTSVSDPTLRVLPVLLTWGTPPEVSTAQMYRGVIPFVALQLVLIAALCIWPGLATWLPELLK